MKKLSLSNFYSFILICSISFLFSQKTCAQENGIYELSGTSNQSKNVNSKNKVNDRDQFYDLTSNLYPTIYIENGSIKTIYGEGDIKKISLEDTNSFKLLTTQDARYNHVELITLILKSPTELNTLLNLSNENEFDKLKFVFIKCYFDFQKEDIEKFIKVKSNVRVFYKLVNPS